MDLPGGAVPFTALAGIDRLTRVRDMMIAIQFDGNTLADKFAQLMNVRSRFVIDHHGKFFKPVSPHGPEVDMIKKLLDKGNCWFKFAGCYESSIMGGPHYDDVAEIALVISEYAPERIVWGTNWPHNSCTTTQTYPDDMTLLDLALSWIPAKYHQKVLAENPEELYGFFRH